jgi:glutamine synthetase
LVEAVGSDLVAQHLAVKRAEWERYLGATTDWELREYLPFL